MMNVLSRSPTRVEQLVHSRSGDTSLYPHFIFDEEKPFQNMTLPPNILFKVV